MQDTRKIVLNIPFELVEVAEELAHLPFFRIHAEDVPVSEHHFGKYKDALLYLLRRGLTGVLGRLEDELAMCRDALARWEEINSFFIQHPTTRNAGANDFSEEVTQAFFASRDMAVHLDATDDDTVVDEEQEELQAIGRIGARRGYLACQGNLASLLEAKVAMQWAMALNPMMAGEMPRRIRPDEGQLHHGIAHQ